MWFSSRRRRYRKRNIYNRLVRTVVKELSIIPEEVDIFFPTDKLEYSVSDNMFVVIDGPFKKLKTKKKTRNRLAKTVGKMLEKFYPESLIECIVKSFDQELGYRSS